MPFLELSLACRQSEQPRIEQAFEATGSLAVTLQDAHLDAADEQAIFEPGVGEQPLWDEMTLTALFDGETDALALLAQLETADPELDWSRARFRKIDDQDWERAWLDQFQPMRFGARTWIVPWDHEVPPEAFMGAAATAIDAAGKPSIEAAAAPTGDDVGSIAAAVAPMKPAIVRLDPGLAFGSGTHATTALCLEWLDGLAQRGELQGRGVLDFGCGSGILALAALKLGAARADGVDNDPQALVASRDNAARNGIAEQLAVYLPQDEPATTYPVVVANILASALDALADTLAARVQPGGRIALSGILAGQEQALLARYAPWFDTLTVTQREDWVRIDGIRIDERRIGGLHRG
jgi:ribosomal protein L11 methyltransferase